MQQRKMTIKLNLLFIALDLLTLLIYPFVYVQVYPTLKAKDRLILKNSLSAVLVTLED